jgi:hypothetical protein
MPRAFLFTLRSDGSPTCHPMVVTRQRDVLTINAYRSSAKIRNLLRDPRAALVTLEDWQSAPSSATALSGSMELIESHPAAAPSASSPPEPAPEVPRSVRERVGNRIAQGKRVQLRFRSGGSDAS